MWRRSWRCRLGWNRRWRCPWRCWRRTYVRSRTPWWSSGSSLRTFAPSTNSYSTSHRWGCCCSFAGLLEKWLGYAHLLGTNILTFALQSSDASSKQKSETISRLEEKINQMTGTVKQMEARWNPISFFLMNKYCCTWLSSESKLIFDCAVFSSLIFMIFHSLDFLFNHVKQRETFGEAGQKPELGSREATAVSAVAPTSLTSNRTILPNIDITKLGFHLFCTSLLCCCWKSNQPPTTSRSGLWVSVDSIDLLAALIFCFWWPMCLVGTPANCSVHAFWLKSG